MTPTESKQRAHTLIEHMGPKEVAAVVSLLEVMLDPVSLALANAPLDDEPVSDEEAREIAASRESCHLAKFTSHEDLLAEFDPVSGGDRNGSNLGKSQTHDLGQ